MKDDAWFAYIQYMRERKKEYKYRSEWHCIRCNHLGSEHDNDEVGECQACGCVAFRYDQS